MAVFNNGNQPSKEHSNTTIITEGSSIKGEMELTCSLYIDGNFEGSIHSSSTITVGRNGKINGEVHAKKLIIQGLIEGSAEADRIEIHADGKMSGKVTSSELVIEAQAIFEGESHFKARPAIANKKASSQVSSPKKKVEELPEKASAEKVSTEKSSKEKTA